MVTMLGVLLLSAPVPEDAATQAAYEVVWTSPSEDSSGSMPLGNGDLGCNAWVEPGGDLVLLLSKTDSWSELGRLLKLGRVRVRFEPALAAMAPGFRQRLSLREGEMTVEAGAGDDSVRLRVWIDANAPVLRVEAESARPRTMRANVELWRTAPRELSGVEVGSDVDRLAAGAGPMVEGPDTVFGETPTGTVIWAHRNPTSVWPASLQIQGLADYTDQWEDPLLGRTFGCLMAGDSLTRVSSTELRSHEPATRHLLEVHALTARTDSVDEWRELVRQRAAETGGTPLEQARAAHLAWWRAFWQRSWIHVSGGGLSSGAPLLARNDLPLRIGADEQGANGFVGDIASVRVYGAALSPEVLAAHAAAEGAPAHERGLVLAWPDGDASMPALSKGGAGSINPGPRGPTLTLDGRGWLEADRSEALDFARSFTLELWARPAALPGGGGRLIDKCPVGTDRGYVLDTYPGASLRLITTAGTLRHDARLAEGRWVHLAGVLDGEAGLMRLYVDGEPVAEQPVARRGDPANVTAGYALQRYMNACAGRGGAPIKFNGSIFTVEPREGDEAGLSPDYRRWGGAYWMQNTRLPYFAMPAAGDYDLMRPLFRMLEDARPLERARVRTWFGHDGVIYPETMSFWGTFGNSDYGIDRTGREPRDCVNPYIRWHYTGSLEALVLMLAYVDGTGDTAFARRRLLPLADEVLAFFEQHYLRGGDGSLRLDPAQSLETWWDVRDPTPDVAGLRWCVGQLIALGPETLGASRLERLRALEAILPALPITRGEDGPRLAPAAEVRTGRTNSETPELYAVWPFRLYGIGRPRLATALRTWEAREVRHRAGWGQDPIQAACLGLAAEAADSVAERFVTKHAGSRFPAFWGPNFDWIPDQDHGAVAMVALQEMLVQTDGSRILLLGGWPREWDVDFQLHTREATTVRCVVQGGEVRTLEVTPAARRSDVLVVGPK